MTASNTALEKVQFQIKKGFDEVKTEEQYLQYYVLVHLDENEQISRLQKNYSEGELDLLRVICFHLINDRSDNTDTEINVANCYLKTHVSRKRLQPMEASRAVEQFIQDGYLVK